MPIIEVSPFFNRFRILKTSDGTDLVHGLQYKFFVGDSPFKHHRIPVGSGHRYEILKSRGTLRAGFTEIAHSAHPLIVKNHVVGSELATVGRWNILPVDAFTQMRDISAGVCKFPAFRQMSFKVL